MNFVDFCRLANQLWCIVETSQDKDAEIGPNVSSKFHFDASSKDDEAGVGLDTSSESAKRSEFHFDTSSEFPLSSEFPFDASFEFYKLRVF